MSNNFEVSNHLRIFAWEMKKELSDYECRIERLWLGNVKVEFF